LGRPYTAEDATVDADWPALPPTPASHAANSGNSVCRRAGERPAERRVSKFGQIVVRRYLHRPCASAKAGV